MASIRWPKWASCIERGRNMISTHPFFIFLWCPPAFGFYFYHRWVWSALLWMSSQSQSIGYHEGYKTSTHNNVPKDLARLALMRQKSDVDRTSTAHGVAISSTYLVLPTKYTITFYLMIIIISLHWAAKRSLHRRATK